MANIGDGASRVTIVEPMKPGTTKDLVALMPRCRDCRFWEQEDWQVTEGVGACLATQDGTRAFPSNPLPSSKALAQGEDGWAAYLQTRPDFGCVQFEAKA